MTVIASILGIIGAILVTSVRSQCRFVAFLCWIVSNVILIWFFLSIRAWPLLGMQSVYLVTSIVGAYTCWPKKDTMSLMYRGSVDVCCDVCAVWVSVPRRNLSLARTLLSKTGWVVRVIDYRRCDVCPACTAALKATK